MIAADVLRIADLVIKVTLLLGVAACATRLLSRRSAATRHHIWTVAIAASLMMPVLSSFGPQWSIAVLPAAPQAVAPAPGLSAATVDVGAAFEVKETIVPSLSPEPPRAQAAAVSPLTTASTIWLAGVVLVLGRLAFGTARLWWIARRAQPAIAWAPLGKQLADSLGIDRHVTFLSGGESTMPMAWGLLRAHVLLPADADEWTATRQRVVLLHELAHVKRRDCLTQLLAHLACAAYWFNPLAWLAARRLRAERERACDDLVLAAGTRGSDYADHLLDIARSLRAGAWPTWSAVTMAHRSQLEGRLMAILDPALPRRSPTPRSILVGAAVAAVAIVSLAGVRAVAKAAEPMAAAPPAAAVAAMAAEPQGRPSRPVSPAPTPTPAPTPAPVAAPRPPAPPAPPSFAWNLLADADVHVDPDVISNAVNDALSSVEINGLNLWAGPRAAQRGADAGPADPKVAAALMGALKDEDQDVRQQALHTLMRMRTPLAADVYMGLLKDKDADMRRQAVFAVGRLRDPKYIPVLNDALKDSDADVRQQAVFALGQLRDKSSFDPLLIALKDADPDVRKQAAFALGQLRDSRAVDALIAALKDSNADVRQQAVFALGQIR